MRLRYASVLLLALVGTATCADPVPKFPDWPVAPRVPDVPSPMPAPASVLNGSDWFVVQSDAEVQLLASPPGLVSITEEVGPIRLRGSFADGGGKVETRTYEKKHVFIVERLAAGQVELLLVPKGAVVRRVIGDGTEPIPPPKPKPEPEPDAGLGLKKASADGLAQVAAPDKKEALAKQQRAHASAVAAGAFNGPAAILAGWRAANNRIEPDLTKLAAWQAKWKPWAAAVSAKLAELHAAGKLPDNAAWAKAFNEIAEGLGG